MEQKGKQNTMGVEGICNSGFICNLVQFVSSSFQAAQQEATLPNSSSFTERKTLTIATRKC